MNAENLISKSIIDWAATRSDEIVFEPKDGFYSFDIVVDAYKKGIGELDAFKEEVRRKYFENAKAAAEVSALAVNMLLKNNIPAQKLFFSNSVDGFNIIITIKEDNFSDPQTIETAYEITFNIQSENLKKGINLQIGLLCDSKDLNEDLLKADGYSFVLDVSKIAIT